MSASATPDEIDRPLHGAVGSATPDDPQLIVEVWLAVATEAGWRLLMCRRVAHRGRFWQGVSGRVEPEDATLREAALREIREELGIDDVAALFDMGRWYEFESIYADHHYYRKRVIGAVLRPDTTPEAVTLCDEHDACRLMTFEEARSVAHFPEHITELKALEARLHRRRRKDPSPPGHGP